MLGLFGPEVVQFFAMSGGSLTFYSNRAKKPGSELKTRISLVGYPKAKYVDIPLRIEHSQANSGGKGHLSTGTIDMSSAHLLQLENLLYYYAPRPDLGEGARRSPRLAVSLKSVSRDLPGYHCVTVDISTQGVRLSCSGAVELGSKIELALETDMSGVQAIQVSGRVVWCRGSQDAKSKTHQIGVDFVDLTPSQEEILGYYTRGLAGRLRGDVMQRQIADGEMTASGELGATAKTLGAAPPPPPT